MKSALYSLFLLLPLLTAAGELAAQHASHGHATHEPARASSHALPSAYDERTIDELVEQAHSRGDARRGLAVIAKAKFACLSCHKVGNHGGTVGPALCDVGKQLKPDEIVVSLLWPKR